jgi:ADP-ribosylglycohydrolase
MDNHEVRLNRARTALEGLAVGDAFGEQFFRIDNIGETLFYKRLPPIPRDGYWRWTDDTNMALSIYAELRLQYQIDHTRLARSFAAHYQAMRGYGAGMHKLLRQLQNGAAWQSAARDLFDGQGSFGNGAAMRISPLGAYFADDLELCVDQARRASETTHAHAEGIAGGIAIAVAAAIAAGLSEHKATRPSRYEFINAIIPYVPQSVVRQQLEIARDLDADAPVIKAVALLGNGDQVTAQDTVGFCLWSAAEHLGNYADALWHTVQALGDIDTNCAIVGGIVASYTQDIPDEMLVVTEPLPDWALGD